MSAVPVPARLEPRWQRRKDARPAELVEAALEMFTERGFVGTRLEDVATRAGVSKGTLYLYFTSKEDLFKAVVRQGLVSPLAQARGLVDAFEGPTVELLRLVARGWWEKVGSTRNGGIPKLMIAEAANFPEIARFYLEEVVLPGHATMMRIIERGIARGEFRAIDPAQAAQLLFAPFIMISAWRHGFGHALRHDLPALVDPPALIETHIDLLVRGLAPTPAIPENPA